MAPKKRWRKQKAKRARQAAARQARNEAAQVADGSAADLSDLAHGMANPECHSLSEHATTDIRDDSPYTAEQLAAFRAEDRRDVWNLVKVLSLVLLGTLAVTLIACLWTWMAIHR